MSQVGVAFLSNFNIFLLILPVVLCGFKKWALTLRDEWRLRVFVIRILRRTFGPKRGGNGEWRGLYNEELRNFYRSSNTARVIKS